MNFALPHTGMGPLTKWTRHTHTTYTSMWPPQRVEANIFETTYQHGAITQNGPDTPMLLIRSCGHHRGWMLLHKTTLHKKPHTSMGPLHRVDQTHPCHLYEHVATAEGVRKYRTKPHTGMGPLRRMDQTHPCQLYGHVATTEGVVHVLWVVVGGSFK